MASYIPGDDAGKVEWLLNFANWLMVNGASHGFTPAEVSQMMSWASAAATSLLNAGTQEAVFHSAVAAKRTDLGNAVGLARDYAQRLQHHSATTDADRAAARITIADPDATPTPVEAIMAISDLFLYLDFSVRRQVTVHWGPNPSNEHQNARPAGTIGCQVQYARGGIPTDEAQWISLEVDTESPLLHIIPETTPTTYAYRARYVSKHVRFGPFCDPVVCTVTV